MSAKGFRTLANVPPFSAESFRDIAEITRQTMQGKMNVVTTLTFTTSESFTVFQDPRIGVDSVFIFNAKTSTAAADQGTIYVTSLASGTAVIHHSISANADRIFGVGIIS